MWQFKREWVRTHEEKNKKKNTMRPLFIKQDIRAKSHLNRSICTTLHLNKIERCSTHFAFNDDLKGLRDYGCAGEGDRSMFDMNTLLVNIWYELLWFVSSTCTRWSGKLIKRMHEHYMTNWYNAIKCIRWMQYKPFSYKSACQTQMQCRHRHDK